MGTTQAALAHALHRIDKLETARRRVMRSLSRCTPGSALARDLSRQRAELDEQLEHWRAVVSRAEAEGFKVWSREDFARGDFIKYLGAWYEVLRVNRRSVTVPYNGGTCTVGYHDGITGRMDARGAAELQGNSRPKDHNE